MYVSDLSQHRRSVADFIPLAMTIESNLHRAMRYTNPLPIGSASADSAA